MLFRDSKKNSVVVSFVTIVIEKNCYVHSVKVTTAFTYEYVYYLHSSFQ